jgi:hypothetical protein
MSEIERDVMEYDVVAVGAGPAGLAFAIRLKQLDPDIGVRDREGLGDRRAHPVRRGDRDRPARRPAAGLARQPAADLRPGDRGRVLAADQDRRPRLPTCRRR